MQNIIQNNIKINLKYSKCTKDIPDTNYPMAVARTVVSVYYSKGKGFFTIILYMFFKAGFAIV